MSNVLSLERFTDTDFEQLILGVEAYLGEVTLAASNVGIYCREDKHEENTDNLDKEVVIQSGGGTTSN